MLHSNRKEGLTEITPHSHVRMARRAQSKNEKETNVVLGQHLAAIRKERGFTQVELAEKLGVIQSVVSSYERGRVRPHPDALIKIAEVLNVSLDNLLGRTREKTSSAALDRRFLRRLHLMKTLPKRDQDALLRTIDAFLSARKTT